MYFVYDNAGFTEATIADGSVSTGSFSASSTVDNEERINDQSILTEITSYVGTDAIRIDFGEAVSVNAIALYMNAQETDDMVLLSSDDGSASAGTVDTLSNTFNANQWTIFTFSEETHRYFVLSQGTGSNTFTGLTEVILGKKLTFEYAPDIGINESYKYGSKNKTSLGGVEYAVKTHEPINSYKLKFSNISSTFKSNLQAVESAVQTHKKFLWNNDSATKYVRLTDSIKYTEIAYERYSASLQLREQLT